MDLPPLVNRSAYDKLNKKIHKAVKEVSLEVMKDACDKVHSSGGVADVDSSILLDTDVDFADVINPSVFVMMTIHLFRVMPMSIHLFSLMLILLIYPFLVMELGTDGDSVP